MATFATVTQYRDPSKLDISPLVKAVEYKQQNYDTNVAAMQQLISQYAGTDLLRGIDKEYMGTRLQHLVDNVNQLGTVDWSRKSLFKNYNQYVGQVLDENVLAAVASTQAYRKHQAHMEDLKKNKPDQYSVQNDWFATQDLDRYMSSNQIGDMYRQGSYTPYVDVQKELKEYLPMLEKFGKKVSWTSDGNPYIEGLSKVESIDQSTALNFLNSFMSNKIKDQLVINGMYASRGLTQEQVANTYTQSIDAQIKGYNDRLGELNALRLKAKGNELELIDNSIKSLTEIKNSRVSHKKDIPSLSKNEMVGKMYVNDFMTKMSNTLSYSNVTDIKYNDRGYKMLKLQLDESYRQADLNLRQNRMTLDAAIQGMEYDTKTGAFTVTEGSLGRLAAIEKIKANARGGGSGSSGTSGDLLEDGSIAFNLKYENGKGADEKNMFNFDDLVNKQKGFESQVLNDISEALKAKGYLGHNSKHVLKLLMNGEMDPTKIFGNDVIKNDNFNKYQVTQATVDSIKSKAEEGLTAMLRDKNVIKMVNDRDLYHFRRMGISNIENLKGDDLKAAKIAMIDDFLESGEVDDRTKSIYKGLRNIYQKELKGTKYEKGAVEGDDSRDGFVTSLGKAGLGMVGSGLYLAASILTGGDKNRAISAGENLKDASRHLVNSGKSIESWVSKVSSLRPNEHIHNFAAGDKDVDFGKRSDGYYLGGSDMIKGHVESLNNSLETALSPYNAVTQKKSLRIAGSDAKSNGGKILRSIAPIFDGVTIDFDKGGEIVRLDNGNYQVIAYDKDSKHGRGAATKVVSRELRADELPSKIASLLQPSSDMYYTVSSGGALSFKTNGGLYKSNKDAYDPTIGEIRTELTIDNTKENILRQIGTDLYKQNESFINRVLNSNVDLKYVPKPNINSYVQEAYLNDDLINSNVLNISELKLNDRVRIQNYSDYFAQEVMINYIIEEVRKRQLGIK